MGDFSLDFDFHRLSKDRCNLYKCIALIAICFVMVYSLLGCYRQRERKYYSDKSNYITCEAVVKNIFLSEDKATVYLWLNPMLDVYSDTTFKIVGKSAEVFINNGGFQIIAQGDTIEFTSAPRYFGDGYVMPIVAVYCDGCILLDFESGYNNLMELY